jgi:hypothetical protein
MTHIRRKCEQQLNHANPLVAATWSKPLKNFNHVGNLPASRLRTRSFSNLLLNNVSNKLYCCILTVLCHKGVHYSSLFDEFHSRFTRVLKWPTRAKTAQFTHERVEYNIFLFDEPLKGSKSLKTFKINFTFRFDKL